MIPVQGEGGRNVEGRVGHPSCSYTLTEVANIGNIIIFLVFVMWKCTWETSWWERKFGGGSIP